MPLTLEPYTSPWWIDRLGKVLDGRALDMTRLDDYYRGRHPLLYSGEKFRAAFGNIFAGFSDNFTALVVDAVEERLDVQGFRMGKEREADADAWEIWQENDLDAWSQVAHIEALVKSASYALVWADEDESDEVEITIQDALEMTVATDRATHDRLAAFKRWMAEDGTVFGTLYLPDRIEKWQRRRKGYAGSGQLGDWEPREVRDEPWPLPNPLGEVPVVPLVNRPRLNGEGDSEIRQVIPIQLALNKLFLDMMTASEFAAYRQRWATGLEIPIDPDSGKPIEPYKAAVDRLWTTENPNVKFGEFEATDLGNYVRSIEMAIQHIASVSRTPVHYLNGQMGSFPSGEALRAAEAGLVSKAKRKQRFFGESWEEVMRLAFKVLDDPRGEINDAETIWADPETRTEAEHVDALVKMGSLGVPHEALWEKWGATPQEIARWKELEAAMPPAPVQPVVPEQPETPETENAGVAA